MAAQSGLTADAVAPFAIIVPPPNLVANTTFFRHRIFFQASFLDPISYFHQNPTVHACKLVSKSNPKCILHRHRQLPITHGLSPTPPAKSCTTPHTSLASSLAPTSVAASAYTLTTSSVPLGRAKALASAPYLATAASIAVCIPVYTKYTCQSF